MSCNAVYYHNTFYVGSWMVKVSRLFRSGPGMTKWPSSWGFLFLSDVITLIQLCWGKWESNVKMMQINNFEINFGITADDCVPIQIFIVLSVLYDGAFWRIYKLSFFPQAPAFSTLSGAGVKCLCRFIPHTNLCTILHGTNACTQHKWRSNLIKVHGNMVKR